MTVTTTATDVVATADVTDLRTLPIRVPPVQGESLDSWLTRSAHAVRSSRGNLLDSFELSPEGLATHTQWAEHVQPEVDDVITRAGGLNPDAVRAMTLSAYAGRAVDFDVQMRVRRLRRWARGSSTRYCPQCLGTNGGAMLLRWRLVWSFACVQHRMMLRDSCPRCQSPIPSNHGRASQQILPGSCAKRLSEGRNAMTCGQHLAASPTEVLPEGHPVLRAQLFLDQLIEAAPDDDVYAVLGDLQAVGRGIIAANLDRDIADHAGLTPGDLSGLKPAEERPGTAAPKDALFMGALMAWGLRILSAPFGDVTAELRELILNFKDGDLAAHSSSTLGSPHEVVGRWGSTSPYLKHRMLRSLDVDLKLSDRLNLGTTASRDADPVEGLRPLRESEVPTLIWPSIAVALDFGGRYNLDAFQRAMSVAVRLANTDDAKFQGTQRAASTRAWRTMRPVFFGDEDTTARIVTTVTVINQLLRSHPPVIDYQRRRQLAGRPGFLTADLWARIAGHVGIIRGGSTRALMARRYAFLRFVGTADTEIPFAWMRANRRDDTALYTAFCTSMTRPLQREIDAYLASVLRTAGIDEPVIWEPNFNPEQLDRISGRLVDDIDYDQLYALLDGGEKRLGVLAHKLDRSSRHVRVAIDRRPRPVPGPAHTLRWETSARHHQHRTSPAKKEMSQ